nr:hypothetical protein FFPRI1PSEUD_27760 [Pseudomonas sp. FFPRI_1]
MGSTRSGWRQLKRAEDVLPLRREAKREFRGRLGEALANDLLTCDLGTTHRRIGQPGKARRPASRAWRMKSAWQGLGIHLGYRRANLYRTQSS